MPNDFAPLHPDGVSIGGDASFAPTVRFAIGLPNGKVSLPAQEFAAGPWACTYSQYVVIFVKFGDLNLHEALTPEGARLFASSLIKSADMVEASLLKQSNAQLATTLQQAKRP